MQETQEQGQSPKQGTCDSWCVPWALAAIPDGAQNRQAALNTNSTKNAEARKISKSLRNNNKWKEVDGNEGEDGNDKRTQEEKVSHSQVKNVDREGIPVHAEAQEPHHYGISCHPNQGKDDEKIKYGLDYDFTMWRIIVGASI